MQALEEQEVSCPYCGEPITLLVDSSAGPHDYTEDCQVCCRPIVVSVDAFGGSELLVAVRREDDA